jgi:hypothetical protein
MGISNTNSISLHHSRAENLMRVLDIARRVSLVQHWLVLLILGIYGWLQGSFTGGSTGGFTDSIRAKKPSASVG